MQSVHNRITRSRTHTHDWGDQTICILMLLYSLFGDCFSKYTCLCKYYTYTVAELEEMELPNISRQLSTHLADIKHTVTDTHDRLQVYSCLSCMFGICVNISICVYVYVCVSSGEPP